MDLFAARFHTLDKCFMWTGPLNTKAEDYFYADKNPQLLNNNQQ